MTQTITEKLAYARGYCAGETRLRMIESAERIQRNKDEFWQRAFLAALPAHISADGWTRGTKFMTTTDECVGLAVSAADSALKQVIAAGRI
jgi:hypothetical protein